ncbi:Baculoviral IAP repeat-containing protein 1g [Stylophora pistillata]|uniref:Baculoviral IAP repeat-containing protein 1g n=1 Tax=Stylophora pistillata TaxID=50429 RepID=A0A2B4R662_STYPI|nr:Baculoviral IAP repeat-containing protein 1g [Stylophora pistillata]
MAGSENDKGSSIMNCSDNPPPLSFSPLKLSDLPKKWKRWSGDHLPVDILLLTVEDCEFLACHHYLRGSYKSYEKSIGYVYFGKMGEDEDEFLLKVALVKCSNESSDPGGSQTAATNAIRLLRPKATILVGFCYSTSSEKAQLGDVVISSKLTTHCHQTPVSRDVGNLVRSAADGWRAPLENPQAHEVKVNCNGEFLSCSDLNGAEQQCQSHPGAIAVEIGGKGLFAAAHDTKTEWVVVKGVCDFVHGSGSTNDSWKTFACAMAASVTFQPEREVATVMILQTNAEKLKVKTVPWNDSSSIPIDEIYTPLSWVRDERTPSGARQEELEDYTDMFKGNKHHRKPTRMLVYGRPGIGKSTFCKKIAYDWSKALKEILMKFYIFLLIKLRDVCDMEHIRDVLVASKLLAGDGPIAVDSLHDYIINNQDKVLLVLDGYDEYSCVKEHSPILEIWRGEQLRDCHVIVTTRQLECDELTGPSHIQFEIHGFRDWKQIRAYAGKFLTSEQDVVKFTAYLTEKALRDLAEIPLLLMMLCRLWNDPPLDGLPTSRAGIYTEFIQTMLNH